MFAPKIQFKKQCCAAARPHGLTKLTHTHTYTHTKSAGKHFAKYTNHAVQSGFCPNLPNEIAEEPEDGVCACKHPTVQELM